MSARWLEDDEQRAWRVYLRATRELNAAMDRDLAPLGISLAEYELLSMLSEQPGGQARMSVLAELIVQSRSRMTHTAKRLGDRGWLDRRPSTEDRRGVVVTLTGEGRAALKRAAPAHVESVRRNFIDLLSADQIGALRDIFGAVRAELVPGATAADRVC